MKYGEIIFIRCEKMLYKILKLYNNHY